MGNSHSTNVDAMKSAGNTFNNLYAPISAQQPARTPVQQPARTRHLGTTSVIQLYQERVNEQKRKIAEMINKEISKRGL